MCGLVGFSGKKNFNKDKINLLLIWNSFERGKDATGLYSNKNDLLKSTDAAPEFLEKIPYEEDNILIAHVRAKTIGSNSIKNTHPFVENNIVLAHNGTLKNHLGLMRKYELPFADFDVDSHVVAGIIGKENNFKVLSEIEGAAAMLIHDKTNPNTLYVFRNGERPLFKGSINGDMYISSLAESLLVIGCKNIKEFKENHLYTIVDGLIKGIPKKITNKPYIHVYDTITNVNDVSYHTYYGHASPDVNELMHMMLKYDAKIYNHGMMQNETCTYGNEYKVIGFDKSLNTVTIIDDLNYRCNVNIHRFNKGESYFTINDYVKCRSKLTIIGQQDVLAIPKDQICLITKEYGNGNVEVLNLLTNEKYDVSKHFFKILSKAELKEFNTLDTQEELDFSDVTSLPNNLNIPFFSEGYEEMDEYYNQDTVDDSDSEEEDDHDEDLDLSVNEAKLVSDIENIQIGVADLVHFVKDFVPVNDEVEFKCLKIELDQTIAECLEFYNITNTLIKKK